MKTCHITKNLNVISKIKKNSKHTQILISTYKFRSLLKNIYYNNTKIFKKMKLYTSLAVIVIACITTPVLPQRWQRQQQQQGKAFFVIIKIKHTKN